VVNIKPKEREVFIIGPSALRVFEPSAAAIGQTLGWRAACQMDPDRASFPGFSALRDGGPRFQQDVRSPS